MDRKAFGNLVTALRKELYDGMGERLTQAKLAKKAQNLEKTTPLTDIIIGKIERGERATLDEYTLLSLADALDLTVGERRIFFLLATGLDNPQMYPWEVDPGEILETAVRMVADIQLPALLLDQYLDVIAVNGAVMAMYQLPPSQLQQPRSFNLLYFIFSDAFAPMREQMSREQWHDFAVGNVIYFRRTTLRYRTTDYFAGLLQDLRRLRDFRWYWEQVYYEEKRYFVGGESFRMGAPGSHRYRFLTAPLVTLTPYGNLELITHIPRDPQTAVAFHQMAQKTVDSVYQLSPWPEKGAQ